MATIHIESKKSHMYKECSNIQSMPFKIDADCDAKVNEYFNNYIKTNSDNVHTASFRGFPLQGKTVEVPERYVGLVLHESIRPSVEKEERKFHVTHRFSALTFWNWNKTPSQNDSINTAMQWIDVAEALHSPILEE